MPAIEYDVVADEGRDWNLALTWYDDAGERVDIEGYGAILEVRVAKTNELISRITHEDRITLSFDEEEPEDPDDSIDGNIDVSVPAADLLNPKSFECVWELFLFPDEDNPKGNPVSLLRGKFTIRKMIAEYEA